MDTAHAPAPPDAPPGSPTKRRAAGPACWASRHQVPLAPCQSSVGYRAGALSSHGLSEFLHAPAKRGIRARWVYVTQNSSTFSAGNGSSVNPPAAAGADRALRAWSVTCGEFLCSVPHISVRFAVVLLAAFDSGAVRSEPAAVAADRPPQYDRRRPLKYPSALYHAHVQGNVGGACRSAEASAFEVIEIRAGSVLR